MGSNAEDIVAIQQLLNTYCHKLDSGDVAGVVAMFAEDAVLRPEYEGDAEHVGRGASEAWYSNYSRTTLAATTGLRHKISTAMIEVNGDSAESVCYLDADSIDPASGARSMAGGSYKDKLGRRNGTWVLTERRIIVDYSTTIPTA